MRSTRNEEESLRACVNERAKMRKKKKKMQDRLPAKIMKIIPRAIPRQRAFPSFSDDVVINGCRRSAFNSTSATTLTMWLLLLLPLLLLWVML